MPEPVRQQPQQQLDLVGPDGTRRDDDALRDGRESRPEAVVVGRDGLAEPLGQPSHVVPVVGVDRVAAVEADLDLGADRPDLTAAHRATTFERPRREDVDPRLGSAVPARPAAARGEHVQVDLATGGVAQRVVPGRGVATVRGPETLAPQRLHDRGLVADLEHEVEVGVLTGLLAEQGVDPPPAVQPDRGAGSLDRVEQLDDVGRPHVSTASGAATGSRPGCSRRAIQ